MHGGWTYTWQGTDSSMYPRNIVTFLDALRGKFGSASVTHVAGAGLSYTTFAYDSIALAKKTLAVGDTIVTSVTITNTGKRAGMEVVQVYSRQFYASVSPPIRRLRDFDKITLSPGERRTVTFRIPVQRLAFVGRDNRLGVEPGEFELQIGGKTARFIVE